MKLGREEEESILLASLLSLTGTLLETIAVSVYVCAMVFLFTVQLSKHRTGTCN
jgi:hypothetical protein